MKVLVINNMAPFVWGGAEELAFHLQKNITLAGHQAEILRVPFQWEPSEKILSQMLMARALELSNVDRVIALKFPAYLIRHPNKTLWLLHQYRQAYDLFDAKQSNISSDANGLALRELIANADNETFAESRNIFTNSEVTRARLKKYNGFEAKVLLPPVNDPEIFLGGKTGDYIFAGGRINGLKRQHLLIEALKFTDPVVKLLIAGPPDCDDDANRLLRFVDQNGLRDRVTLDLRFLPRATYASYVNNAASVAYLPYDEDSLGYVAMEAATASKALITTSDSGGILGLVRNEETGWVSEPSATELAFAMNNVFKDANRTKRFGEAAHSLWKSLKISWPDTVKALLK